MLTLVNLLTLASQASAMLMASMPSNPYESACTGQVGYLYLFNNPDCASLRYDNRVKCQCPDPAFAQTVINCMDQMVDEFAGHSQEHLLMEAYMSFQMVCSNYSMADFNAFHANSSSLPVYREDAKNGYKPGKWPAHEAFALPKEEVIASYRAFTTYDRSEYLNKRYGAVLVGYWGCIAAIQALLHWAAKVFPLPMASVNNSTPVRKFRKYFVIKHYALTDYLGLTMMQFLIIMGFAVLCVTFTFANLPVSYPNYNWMNSHAATYGTIVGQRSGVLCLYLLPILLLFAGRNNFLQWLTGWTIGPYLAFHKWIARGEIFLLIVHSIGYSIGRAYVGRYGEMWSQAYWNWGVAGTVFGCILIVQGARFLRRWAYDVFVVLHIVIVIAFLLGGYYHIKLLDEPIGLYFYYACFAVWGVDRALRLTRVITSGPYRKAMVRLEDNTLVVSIKKPRHWNLVRNPSPHVFIHFWQPSLFWQSHPFTVVSSTTSPDNLKLFCKVWNGATKVVANRLLKNYERLGGVALNSADGAATTASPEQSKSLADSHSFSDAGDAGIPHAEMSILLDGPYGRSQDLFEFDECVFIAGGTGITPILGYMQESLYRYTNHLQTLRLYWAVKDETAIEKCYTEELYHLRKSAGVEVHLFSSKSQRLDIPKVIESSVRNSRGTLALMCCGPPSVALSASRAVADNFERTSNYVEYFEQLITW